MQTYARLPVAFTRGEGAWLWDAAGNKYLDALTGIAVCGLGHAHPAVTRAVCEQAGTLVHTSNWYEIPHQATLAERLCRVAGMERAFFCNSGAEANEAAIKLARLYGSKRKVLAPAIIVMEGSFHGRTLATLSATGNRRIQAGFEPLVTGFYRVPYNDVEALKAVAEKNADVVAVLVEPVLGEGGVVVPAADYLKEIRAICDSRGLLLMLDEVQTGMGRTGHWFAYQHAGIVPDVMTVAKALGNGVPIGACLARGEAAETFQAGNHGSTYGGNPLACRAAAAVLDVIEEQKLPARAAALGKRIVDGLREGLEGVDGVVDVRGLGLMIGIELARPCKDVMQLALKDGLLVNVTAERVVRLLPPLTLTDEEADRIASGTAQAIRRFLEAA